jgi:hypothetical protein
MLLSLLYLDRISRLPPSHHLEEDKTPRFLFPSIQRAPSTPKTSKGTQRQSGPAFNSLTAHRLLCATLLVTSKFISDGFFPQPRAAKIGGIALNELMRLEVEVLKALEWSLFFHLEDLEEIAGAVLTVGVESGIIDETKLSTLSTSVRPSVSPVPSYSSDSSSSSSFISAFSSPPLIGTPDGSMHSPSPSPPTTPSLSSSEASWAEEEGWKRSTAATGADRGLVGSKSCDTVRMLGRISLDDD